MPPLFASFLAKIGPKYVGKRACNSSPFSEAVNTRGRAAGGYFISGEMGKKGKCVCLLHSPEKGTILLTVSNKRIHEEKEKTLFFPRCHEVFPIILR